MSMPIRDQPGLGHLLPKRSGSRAAAPIRIYTHILPLVAMKGDAFAMLKRTGCELCLRYI